MVEVEFGRLGMTGEVKLVFEINAFVCYYNNKRSTNLHDIRILKPSFPADNFQFFIIETRGRFPKALSKLQTSTSRCEMQSFH
jgi:hypothetical protein